MKKEIHYCDYTLRSKAALNARSSRTAHSGALIRVSDGDGVGYGCLHPWVDLGDLPLVDLLGVLRDGGTSPLVRAALACAKVDGEARSRGVSLFDDLTVPQSHATVMMDEAAVDEAVTAGFDLIKLKMGRDLEAEREFLITQIGRYPSVRWRLDFNGEGGEQWVRSFPRGVLERVDFIEDPCGHNDPCWRILTEKYGVSAAVDRNVERGQGEASVLVIKPAVNFVQPLLERAYTENWRVVITSYMDHPLGQCFAAWRAGVAAREFPGTVGTCGLMTHGLFEPDEFTKAMASPSPEFHSPAGTGLGFDNLLENLPWKPLS
ncbi:MAG: hypothetical protein ACPG32_03375 [Akkermansiaceae bacterium]